MAITVTSKNTFSIPVQPRRQDETVLGALANCTFKRISANGVVPVIIEGDFSINVQSEIVPNHYLSFLDPVGTTLADIETNKIEHVDNIWNLGANTLHKDTVNPSKLLKTGATNLTTEFIIGRTVKIKDVEYNIMEVATTYIVLDKEAEFYITEVPYYYSTFKITMYNPIGAHWNTFPLTATSDNLWAKYDQVKYTDDYTVELYYNVRGVRNDELLYDIIATPTVVGIDLNMTVYYFKFPPTKEDVRVGNIFDSDYYSVKTIKTSSVLDDDLNIIDGNGVSVRGSIEMGLTDKIMKIVLSPDINDDMAIDIEIRENGIGERTPISIPTI